MNDRFVDPRMDDDDELPEFFEDSFDEDDEFERGDDFDATPKRPTIDETVAHLKAFGDGTLTAALYYGLSDLSNDEIAVLKPAWKALPADVRQRILVDLVEVSEVNFELDYNPLALFSADDADALVRAAAVSLLWADESPTALNLLRRYALHDPSSEVREAALVLLGNFIYAGEMGKLSRPVFSSLLNEVIQLYNDPTQPLNTRRRAIEALGNASDDAINALIETAYYSQEPLMRQSAVFAMGRTCDERWEPVILQELAGNVPGMRFEAARAAGEIGLPSAVPLLIQYSAEEDRELQMMAIGSLGEIGTDKSKNFLEKLFVHAQTHADADLEEAVEEALTMIALSSELDALLGDEFDEDDPRN